MDFSSLWDGTGAAIVLGGTALATVMGSGREELAAMGASLRRLLRPAFSFERSRAEIASDVAVIEHDGVLRAGPCHSSDEEIAAATDALVRARSLEALLKTHEEFRARRLEMRERALRPLRLAAELAPAFGMVGTLFALTRLQDGGGSAGPMLSHIGLAILTTLYGLLLAHLVFHPLARLIQRRATREEDDRQLLTDWLARHVEKSCPPRRERRKAKLDAAA